MQEIGSDVEKHTPMYLQESQPKTYMKVDLVMNIDHKRINKPNALNMGHYQIESYMLGVLPNSKDH